MDAPSRGGVKGNGDNDLVTPSARLGERALAGCSPAPPLPWGPSPAGKPCSTGEAGGPGPEMAHQANAAPVPRRAGAVWAAAGMSP